MCYFVIRMFRRRFFFLVAGAIAGCSNSSDGGGDATASCASLAAASCAHLSTCDGFSFRISYEDDAACRASTRAICLDEASAPGTGQTPDRISACAAAIGNSTCNGGLPEACKPAGTRDAGQKCLYGSQCASTYCLRSADAACGTCQAVAKVGDACGAGTVCADAACRAGTCVAFAAKGESCASTPCAVGLVCVAGAMTCQDPPTAGSTCDPSGTSQCYEADGLHCSSTTEQCTAATFAEAGESCGVTSDAAIVCSGNGVCAASGTCMAPVQAGQACDFAAGPSCVPPAACVSSQCQILKAASCG